MSSRACKDRDQKIITFPPVKPVHILGTMGSAGGGGLTSSVKAGCSNIKLEAPSLHILWEMEIIAGSSIC